VPRCRSATEIQISTVGPTSRHSPLPDACCSLQPFDNMKKRSFIPTLMCCPEGLGDARSSEHRREGDTDGGVGEGDRRHNVVQVNGQEAGREG